MASVKDMMIDSLSKASKAAEQITSNVERAAAFTALANACAVALSTKGDGVEVPATVLETASALEEKTKKTSKKDTVKQSAPKKKKEEPAPEPEEEPVEETAGEGEATLTEEWDATAMELLAEEMSEMNRYCEMFSDDEDMLNDMISDATEGTATNRDEVTPLNIKMVVAYLQAKEAAAAEEEEEEE